MRSQLGKATALAIMGEDPQRVAGWEGAGPRALSGGLIPPPRLPRGQAVVGRSGVGEDGHLQQG